MSTIYGLTGFTQEAIKCRATPEKPGQVIQPGDDYNYRVHRWVVDSFGKDPLRWRFDNSRVYHFRDQEDATLFILRWM